LILFNRNKYLSVEINSDFGCKSSDSIKILSCAVDSIPSVFTPNGDGDNDFWIIPYLQNYPEASVDVYDRWGNMVFHAERGYNKPWDGKVNGVFLPTENYIYIIKIDKTSIPFVGNVTIIK